MAKLPTWSEIVYQITTTMQEDAALWQQFWTDAQAGTATPSEFIQDWALTVQSWMDVWATFLGAGGSPTPPTVFILGDPWPYTMPTKSGTCRLEVPLDPTTNPLVVTSPLVHVGDGPNPYPITFTAAYEGAGSQVKVNVSRSSTSGQDPTPGMHQGAVYTTGEAFLASVFVWVP